MIGPIKKGFAKAKIASPPVGNYKGVDLRILPQYISYKAALLREKLTLQYILALVTCLFIFQYLSSRIEISNLYTKLREKEYILAPGVMDFTTASPQMVTDSYINDATTDFISNLGNVNATTIGEQYSALKRSMSDDLKIQFDIDTSDWIEQVKNEKLSQIIKIMEKKITSNESGAYKVVALVRADFYTEQQYLGYENQVVKMTMKLVPPDKEKRWYLQITSLSWEKAETFRTKSNLSKPKTK